MTKKSIKDLLLLEKAVMQALKDKGVIKTNNNLCENLVVGDLSEKLFAETYNLSLETKPNSGYDCLSPDGTRYQVKGKICHKDQNTIRFVAGENLHSDRFDRLGLVLFDENFDVLKAWVMSSDVAKKLFAHSGRVVSVDIDTFGQMPGVEDVTVQIAQTWANFSKNETLLGGEKCILSENSCL